MNEITKRTPRIKSEADQLPPVKHGLYVRSTSGLRLRDHKVGRLVTKMRAAMHWIEDSDLPACRGWAQMEVLATIAFADLREKRMLNKRGDPRRLLSEFRQLRQAQLAYERELGMSPASRMAIKANGTRAALDLVAAMGQTDTDQDEGSYDRCDVPPSAYRDPDKR